MAIDFNNTKVAFAPLSNAVLKRAYWLFKMVGNPGLVNIGRIFTDFAIKLHIPIGWAIKPTIFAHFCGGESVAESKKRVEGLGKYHVKSILDYSSEGKDTEADFEHCASEIISVIKESITNKNIAFAVFKPTGMMRFELMEKLNELGSVSKLSATEQEEYEKVRRRVHRVCKASADVNLQIFIDAEETWIQQAVDNLITEMMQLFNKERVIVYNTLQMYRHDRLAFLENAYKHAKENNYHIGFKLVRGAYMEKERERAQAKGYPSPINATKELTDEHFDNAVRFCIDHIDRVAVCCASHNENSANVTVDEMKKRNLPNNHPSVYFSQLLGMSDHISYNLAAAGYNVSKYVPYGPVRDVMPYLIRRAYENTSMGGQTGRELKLIEIELKRRKLA